MQAPATAAATSPSSPARLARLVRQQFTQGWCAGLPGVSQALAEFLTVLRSQTGTQRDMQLWRDAWQQFQQHQAEWVQSATVASTQGGAPAETDRTRLMVGNDAFELLSDEVVDNRIVAARMALAVTEKTSAAYEPLRLRLYAVEGRDLSASDFLRPENLCLLLVEHWGRAGLSQGELAMVMEALQSALADLLRELYGKGNDFLAGQGVQAQQQELRVRVNPSLSSGSGANAGAGAHSASGSVTAFGAAPGARSSDWGQGTPSLQVHGIHRSHGSEFAPHGPASAPGHSPMARARARAQGVMGRLRRLLMPFGAWQQQEGDGQPRASNFGAEAGPPQAPASAALARALAAHQVQAETYYNTVGTVLQDYSPAAIVRLVGAVRERTVQLKKAASTDSEKAIIEVVALMFQSILSEERIPSMVRVWFARLQVPVLRVALAEPEFFSNLNHPARQLIDRMGSVVLGFDASVLDGSALEGEIRRVVQVIEQYPETGRRVFQLVHDEFEKFLAKFLTEKQLTARLVSVAQQVEQKETLVIQYTIELRALLKDMPVREEVRDFLFKVWAEVLALSAVREGAQHPGTVALRRAAADLVWAASAKPHRHERAQVIQALPGLLQRLRQGLSLVGMAAVAQDAQIKVLTDTLAQAFLSKTDASIPYEHIEAMARRLDNLEDVMADTTLGAFPLDAEHIEMGLGIDASALHVMADHGTPVDDAMLEWAQKLPLGQWFTLDHNGARAQVQYVWHSQRKQLHLFATTDGTTYLVQLLRLGAYLQSGLLLAQDEERLTVRATRDALAKLDANPERLLN